MNDDTRVKNMDVILKNAKEAKLELWVYEGTLIFQTRLFCRHLINLPYCYTMDQILKMDNGKGSNPFTHRGGENCRHGWAAGEKGWPGFQKPYAKDGEYITLKDELYDLEITVPKG